MPDKKENAAFAFGVWFGIVCAVVVFLIFGGIWLW